MSIDLKYSKIEIQKAKKCLSKLNASGDFNDYEYNWRNLLGHLEKCWNKSAVECEPIKNKFNPWQGKYTSQRRKDPLLSYLKQARDSDNHSIQEIMEKTNDTITINPANSSAHIKSLAIMPDGTIHYEGDPIILTKVPGKPKVITVVNYGKAYTPPRFHLGKPIFKHEDPAVIATLGIDFYENYLFEIEGRF